MSTKKLSELAGVSSVNRRFAPNGWIDGKGKLCLTIRPDGARREISFKTACLIDDHYDEFLAAAREAIAPEFEARLRAEHVANLEAVRAAEKAEKDSEKADAQLSAATSGKQGKAPLSAYVGGRVIG
jgi:hypothetical protein